MCTIFPREYQCASVVRCGFVATHVQQVNKRLASPLNNICQDENTTITNAGVKHCIMIV